MTRVPENLEARIRVLARDLLLERNLDPIEIEDARFVTKYGGYCETCRYEYEVLRVTYVCGCCGDGREEVEEFKMSYTDALERLLNG